MLYNDLLENTSDNIEKFDIKKYFPDSKWTLTEGLVVCRLLEPIAQKHNFHIALAGSVLIKGQSDKDLDVFFYQRSSNGKTSTPEEIMTELITIAGFGNIFKKIPFKYTGKLVFATSFFGKRVDVFFWLLEPQIIVHPIHEEGVPY